MTVEIETNWVRHLGNGVTTQFPYTFRITDMATVVVSLQSAVSGAIIRDLDPGEYTITGVNPDNYDGGEVTYPLSGPALEDDTYLLIQRIVPYKQELDIENQGGFYPESVEYQLDKLEFQIQQLKTATDGAIIVPPGVEPPDVTEIEAWAAEAAESAAQAKTARDFAREWASNPEDVLVNDTINPPGYSSYHWAQKAEEYSGSVQFPVSYGVAQSLSPSQRLQAQTNIGLQFRVTPQMFGAVGNGMSDDYAAVRACILSGFPVDWGDASKVYRIATPLNETIDHKIDWVSSGATIIYDGAVAQCAFQLFVHPHEHTSIGQLLFDANMKSFVAFDLENAPGTVGAYPDGMPSFYAEDLRATRAYRSSLAFTKGDGIWISGGWSEVSLVRPHVTNCFMAVGAAVPGNQGIFGITVTRNNSTEDSPMRVYIDDCFIDNITNEDTSSSSDQDGIRVFSYYQGDVDDPVQSFFRIRGGEIRNCRNRSIKGQMQWGSVEGVKIVKIGSEVDPGGLGQSNTADIDLQIGGGSVDNIEVYYDGYVPLAICAFGESVRPTKKTSMPVFGNIRGIIKGATLPYVARFVGAANAGRYNGILRDVNLVGSVNHIIGVSGASSLVGQPKVDVSNVFADIETAAVNFISGGNLRAFLSGVHNTKRDGGGTLIPADIILNASGNTTRFVSAINCSGFKDYARSTPTQQPAMLRVDAIGSTEGGDSGIIRPISFTVPNDGVIQLPLTGSFGSCIMLFAIGSGGPGSRRSGLLQIASGDVIALTDLGANITVGTTSEPVSGLYRFWASGSANKGPWFANRSGATRTFFAVMIGA